MSQKGTSDQGLLGYIYSNNELTLHVLFLFNINYAK